MASEVAVQLANQHPLHGVLGEVYDELGGKDFVKEWAEENPGAYIKLLMASTPSMTPMNHVQGDVTLIVHPTLAPTVLDGEVIEQSAREAEVVAVQE